MLEVGDERVESATQVLFVVAWGCHILQSGPLPMICSSHGSPGI